MVKYPWIKKKKDKSHPSKEGVEEGLGIGSEGSMTENISPWQVRKIFRINRHNTSEGHRETHCSQDGPSCSASCWSLLNLHQIYWKVVFQVSMLHSCFNPLPHLLGMYV